MSLSHDTPVPWILGLLCITRNLVLYSSPLIVSSFLLYWSSFLLFFFFFNDTAPTEIYTLSLHDALPIWLDGRRFIATDEFTVADILMAHVLACIPDRTLTAPCPAVVANRDRCLARPAWQRTLDRKSTRLNSSHSQISYAVFCLKKKKKHR